MQQSERMISNIYEILSNRTPKSKVAYERATKTIPGGLMSGARFLKPYPFFVESGKGSKILDIDGNVYIDCRLGMGPLLLGHANKVVVDAVKSAAEKSTIFAAPHQGEALLAELVLRSVPSAEKVTFCNSGTEATLYALRMARAFTGRTKIAKFEGGFHGFHDYAMLNIHDPALGGPIDQEIKQIPDCLGLTPEALSTVVILPYNHNIAIDRIKKHGNELAAVIVEPVQGVAGVIPGNKDFLHELRRITQEHGIILIFDEIQTGFRLGLGGGQEHYGITGDLGTYGKILGGGLPIGAVAGKAEILDLLSTARKGKTRNDQISYGGTFNSNPITTAAGIATLQYLIEHKDKVYSQLNSMGEKIRNGVNSFAQKAGLCVTMTGIGSMFATHMTDPPIKSSRDLIAENKEAVDNFSLFLVKNGVVCNPTHGFISIKHDPGDIEKIITAHTESLSEMSELKLL